MSSQYINEPVTSGKVVLHTTAGDIEIELWAKETPMTCRNFVQLCMDGYYKGCVFHRIVKNFILQGGDPTGTGKGGESIYGATFRDEFHQRLKFTRRGILGMANAGRDDNGSQFFFTLNEHGAPELNNKHTVFGKVTGPTLFNMLKITEVDIKDERPVTMYKITGATIVNNPFKDIVPREKVKKAKKHQEEKVVETKKPSLLSFGDEADEDEKELTQINKKLNKAKSAHDALDDERLSKQVAVTKDEMTNYQPEEDDEKGKASISSVREKLLKKKKVTIKEEEKDEDFEKMIDEERKMKEKEELDKVASELKTMQKEYIKALRKPKEKIKNEDEEPQTEAMVTYTQLKMKFKNKAKDIVKQKDEQRQSQTMDMLDKFKRKLLKSNQEAILFDKKVKLAEDDETFGMDLDAEDEQGTHWMKNRFKARDVDPKVSRAKDANMRDIDEDWYEITDPRNKMSKRRRGEMD